MITDIDPQDMSVDSSGTKNYSSFLVELSGLVAGDMLPSIEPLLFHLEGEVSWYTLNNVFIYFIVLYHTECCVNCLWWDHIIFTNRIRNQHGITEHS